MESINTPPQIETPSSERLLPLWSTVGKTYATVWLYRGEYLKIIWCWLLLTSILISLYSYFSWPYLRDGACFFFDALKSGLDAAHDGDAIDADSMPVPDMHRHSLFLQAPMEIFTLFTGASVAVAWHRLVLRQEKITKGPYLRRDSVVWDYFIFAFLFWCPMWLFGFVPETWPASTFGLLVVLVFVFTRLSVILPARALSRKDVTIKKVWEKTGWNFWRIFWGGHSYAFQ